MDFPPFEHAQWLAQAWRHGPPKHNLGSSGFAHPLAAAYATAEPDDVTLIDLDAGHHLRDRIAARHQLAPEQVQVTAGTSAANTAVLAALIRPGCNVVSERPTYTPLAQIAHAFGAEIRWIDRGEPWDLDAVADACDDATAAILCTSPGNPTGRPLDAATLRRLGDIAASVGARVLVDQVYRELTEHPLGAAVHPAIISTAGMNKCWGGAGLRVGWMIGNDLEPMRRAAQLLHLAPSTFGMRVAGQMLDNEPAFQQELQRHLDAVHPVYDAWADSMGADRATGLVAFAPMPDSLATAKRLLRDGVLTVPGDLFMGPGHVRIGLGVGADELAASLDALSSGLRAQTF
ncbi:MAG: pyridoxal phosphate-dependent aminotransferase [Thermoplasmatota archaeon]